MDKIGVKLLNDLAYRTNPNPEYLDNKTDLRTNGSTIIMFHLDMPAVDPGAENDNYQIKINCQFNSFHAG